MFWWLFRARNRLKSLFKLHPHIQKQTLKKSAIFTDIGTTIFTRNFYGASNLFDGGNNIEEKKILARRTGCFGFTPKNSG